MGGLGISSTKVPAFWLLDLIRHRFSKLNTNPIDGISKSGLSRLWNLFPSPDCYKKDPLVDFPMEHYLRFVGEWDHILDVNYQAKDPYDIFSVSLPRPYRIIERTPGHLQVGTLKGVNYSLLFSTKSSSMLVDDFPALKDEIIHLKSCHRIIPTRIATDMKLTKFNRYPDARMYPKEPVEFIESCFSNSPNESLIKESEYHTSRLLDLESADIEIDVYVSRMQQEWRRARGWENNIKGGLKVVRNNSTSVYRLEVLVRDPPKQTSDYSTPKLRGYKLHKITKIEGKKDNIQSVVIYDPENRKKIAPPFRDYIEKIHPNLVKFVCFDILRDTIRAYVCAAGKWDRVVDRETHLFPFIFREHLNNSDGLFESLESVGINTTQFRINILNSLWVNP